MPKKPTPEEIAAEWARWEESLPDSTFDEFTKGQEERFLFLEECGKDWWREIDANGEDEVQELDVVVLWTYRQECLTDTEVDDLLKGQ